MIYWIFLLPIFLFNPVFAQTSSDEISNSSQYVLKFNGESFFISYKVNADILVMLIDPESTSLLIGLENTMNSQFMLELDNELINAKNNDFIILVDGQETDYTVTSELNNSTFTFFVPIGSEEIEIIGTHVVPEFPSSIIFVFLVIVSTIIILQRKPLFSKL
ncbi:MAG: hypothetical protein ITD33_06860 [Nitrosarchaeum sp.]|nr:hypothetical protein [Nitrosarchaeum sp.]MBP0120557.1 hypothetical protein [Nitrosarchaeum sp.]MBP0133492.1 hypothetical protein [Nitrosarchaeum sp.]